MADATQTKIDYRTENIRFLTENLYGEARQSNKNILVLKPRHDSGKTFMNVRVYFTKNEDKISTIKWYDEQVLMKDNDFDLSFLQLVFLIMRLGYKHDAMMCSTLNDIQSPFMTEDGCTSILQPRLVDLAQISKSEHAEMAQSLATMIALLSDPNFERGDFDAYKYLTTGY